MHASLNESVFLGQNSRQQCVAMSLYDPWFTITNMESDHAIIIYSANDLQSIMNIGNQLYSSLSQLTRRSFLMHTKLPTVLNVFKTGCEVWLWSSN